MKTFKSQTKLMLTGEYLVLKGAISLALPLKFSQQLTVQENQGIPSVKWTSLIDNDLWFHATILLPDFHISETNNPGLSETLVKILQTAKILNPRFLEHGKEHQVTSLMDFNPSWGIGSSSSLISNIAWWAECDPFKLNNLIFNGSGYDIACARSSSPIRYQISENQPLYEKSDFHPNFFRQIYFIYLNRKQNSKESIGKSDLSNVKPEDIGSISELTISLEKANSLSIFMELMNQHEELISNILQIEPVKSLYFNDFKGSIKSLGAWGGDFIMAASSESEQYIRNYFAGKNLNTIFRYDEVITF